MRRDLEQRARSEVIALEDAAGLETYEAYSGFQQSAEAAKLGLLDFLLTARHKGEQVIGYGAAAKGNTLLNYAGIRADLLPMVADRALSKQGKYLPGSHIPVIPPEELDAFNPDSILVLPWNLINELSEAMPQHRLLTAIPKLQVIQNREF